MDHNVIPFRPTREAANWTAQARELTTAYQVAERITNARELAERATDTITGVSRYIDQTGPHHPALEAELRAIEVTVARACATLLHDYLGSR